MILGFAMNSYKKKRDKLPPFVPVLKEMIRSPAYKELTNAARTAHLLLKCQCCKFGQDEVRLPYRHTSEYMDQHTFSKAITQLSDLGFIEKTFEGGLYRRTNVYKFSEKWRDIKG